MSTIKTWQERFRAWRSPVFQDEPIENKDAYVATDHLIAEIAELRAALAASGGNAALTDEQIKGICITAEHAGVEEGMRVAKSYLASASAPNAALVALKEACDLIRLEVADGVHTEEYRRGMAALSAAGQEVGK